ncbi:MAG: hypothetical protein RL277_2438 [Planctomycetota bacterium]
MALAGGVLWSPQPAQHFTQSYPVGNGRLGALVFGGVARERIVLNESSMWSGSVENPDRPDAHKALPGILAALRAGDNPRAEELVNAHFTCAGRGSGHGSGKSVPFGCYQTLGDLELEFPGLGEAREYRRELDPRTGVVTTRFLAGERTHVREVFADRHSDLLLLRLRTDAPGALDVDVRLSRRERAQSEARGGELRMEGRLESGQEDVAGLEWGATLRCRPLGGTLVAEQDRLQVRGADELLLVLAARTSYSGPVRGDFAGARWRSAIEQDLARVPDSRGIDARTLLAQSRIAHAQAMGRVQLELAGTPEERAALPTAQRLADFARGTPDPALAVLLYDYGRHLLLSSTRPGALPPNLQGLWAEEYQTPWNGDYHLNINVQMNHWPAETAALPECHEPLARLVEALVEPGSRTARAYYDAPGWVAHVITNVWGFTAPGEHAGWGSTNTGGAWLARHLHEAWEFSQDDALLERNWPVLKGASEFMLAALVEDPVSGRLVTGVSNSPENALRLPDGRTAHTCMGPAMDQSLCRELFRNTILVSERLGVDELFRARLREALARLAPLRIGSDGRVMEWQQEYGEPEPQHRHVSHLYGLYPGEQITPRGTPELAAAARATLEARGDGGTGWSMAWKIAFWARLHDGERAHRLLRQFLHPVGQPGFDAGRGGTYPNLFCAHPPFQIDGNFGATAAIGEMLLQSHPEREGEPPLIACLPALPGAWPSGSVRGLRARGGLAVDMQWSQGRLEWVALINKQSRPVRARLRAGVELEGHEADAAGIVELPLEPGQRMVLRRRGS